MVKVMEIPSEVKIGNINFEVVKTKNNLVFEGDPVDGIISFEESKIELGVLNRSQQVIEETFIHEVIHGIFGYMSIEQNEELIIKISKGLHQVIKDNPEIFKNEVAMDISKSDSISIEIIIGEVERRMVGALFDMSKRNPCEIRTRIEKELSGLNEFLREQYE